ncbi:transcription-repair coupling factor, partial [Amycolatopsis sp. 3B14]
MSDPQLSGLLSAVLPDPALRAVIERAGAPLLELSGATATRQLVVAALASDAGAGRPVLAVTATGREAEELTAALASLIGADAVADFPSWETLPHERLSPRADTVGRRLDVLHRLHTDRAPRVVVATVRSLIQPMAPGLGSLAPVELRVGEEEEFEPLLERLVELAYTRVDMVEKRGEFAVRGGILDIFPPTADHPYRVEFWGDEVSEVRAFAVSDQRSLPGELSSVYAPPCRELLLTPDVKARAGELAEQYEADAQLAEMLTKLAGGIPVEGMEALIPVLCEGELELLTDAMPEGTHVVLADPEKIRARAADLVRTGQEFLEASWMSAAGGGQAPIDLGASAYRNLEEVAKHAGETGRPWWTLSQLTSEDADVIRIGVEASPAYRGDLERAVADLRAHLAADGTAVLVVAGHGTAARAVEQLSTAGISATHAADGLLDQPAPGIVTVACGGLAEGFVAPELR